MFVLVVLLPMFSMFLVSGFLGTDSGKSLLTVLQKLGK